MDKLFFKTMGTKTILGGVFLACAATLLAGISPASAATTIPYGTTISGHETWTAGNSPYIVSNVFVPSGATLTIEPGAIMKGVNNLGVQGTLIVGAAGADKVTFTSSADDTAGGDTDGNSGNPNVLGDWGGINISSNGTATITDTVFKYGGQPGFYAVSSAGNGTLSILNSEFLYGDNAIQVAGGTADVHDNSFKDVGQYGIRQTDGVLKLAKNSFSGVGLRDILLKGGVMENGGGQSGTGAIYIENYTLPADLSLPKDHLPYVINSVTVPAGRILSIAPGVIVKMWNGAWPIMSSGTLVIGSSDLDAEKVIITSYKDDTVGGNTDGVAATPPTYGDWGGINLVRGTATIANTIFKYGGFGTQSILYDSGAVVSVLRSEFTNGNNGITMAGGVVEVHESSFHDIDQYAVWNLVPDAQLNAENNWWGGISGPWHATISPSGLGVRVVGNIDFDPWRTCYGDTCHSNVLFLPGILGSRLYGANDDGQQAQLWFSNSDSGQDNLEMNSDGTSKNSIYTRDDTHRENWELDETGLLDDVHGSGLYESFIDDLHDWKEQGVFADYAFIPYDWRLSPKDIVMNGKVTNSRLSYTDHNTDLTKSYLYQQAKALQATSHSGKLTLIGHSNGGLVIKAFIQKLKEENDPLYSQIDKVVFVGVPQLGTPDSVVSLLYGSKIGIAWLGISAQMTRKIGHYMPGMYNLLPSQELFDAINPPIEFKGNNIDPAWISRYGVKIDTYAEFKDFLTGKEGRSHPDQTDTEQPEVLDSALVGRAEDNHAVWDDDWEPSSETEVIQVAGWGLYTVSGLEITDAKLCPFDANQLDNGRPVCNDNRISTVTVRDRLTLNGDATVIVPSALAMDEGGRVKKYWVDLASYNRANFFSAKEHKDILEVDTLRPFIKSLIENSGIDFRYISDSEPAKPSNVKYVKYEIHSPLYLTVTDTEGNKAGWDSQTDAIVENIKGAQYFETGEVKMLLVPEETEHTVKLSAYEQGSFTLNIDTLDGEDIVSETKFEAIPVLSNSVVGVVPATASEPIQMSIDFDANGSADTELEVVPGETAEYENPAEQDTVAPEIAVTFDQTAKDVVWKATDNQDGNPSLVVTTTEVTATDKAGNTTVIPFVKYRENVTRLRVQFEKVVYNGEEATIPKTTIVYDWKLKKNVLTDLDTELRLKEKSRLKAEYRKQKNETRIVERDKEEKTKNVATKPGFVSINVETKNGDVIWGY